MATSNTAPKRKFGEVDSGATLSYESEAFIFDPTGLKQKRQRPTKVYGEIAVRDGARESDQLHPLACKTPRGVFEETPAPFAAGGHLVASILAGSNSPRNLVPVSTEFNTQMKSIELTIKALIEVQNVVNPSLTVTVTSYWDDKDPRIPKTIKYKLRYQVRTETGMSEDMKFRHKRKAQKTQASVPIYDFEDRVQTFGPITQSFLVVTQQKQHTNLEAFLTGLKAEMNRIQWKVEDLPRYPKFVSDDMRTIAWNARPYAVLDYWFLVKNGQGYKAETYSAIADMYKASIDVGCEFNTVQKDLLRRVCYAFNRGYLKSDAHGVQGRPGVPINEPHQNLIHGAAGNGESFDHYCPVARNGSNLFSNCMVTSAAFNSRKGKQF